MFRKIIGTFTSKFLAALLNFLIVIITAQYLGAEGKGITSILLANVTVIVLFNDIIGGGSLVYLVPRQRLFQILLPSYSWAIINSLLIGLILSFLNTNPPEYNIHVIVLAVLHCFFSINLTIFIAKEKVKLHNILFFLKVALNLLALYIIYQFDNWVNVEGFLVALYIGIGSITVLSFWWIFRMIDGFSMSGISQTFRELLRHGAVIQIGNILQFMNYRLSYYLLEKMTPNGHEKVGIYSVGVSIVEALMLIGRSISLIQYARIANNNDPEYARRLTVRLSGISISGIFLCMVPLALLPESFYRLVFGADFGAARNVILVLAPGILALGLNTILSHYFSGIGRFSVNTIASGIGFVVTVIAGFILIPRYEEIGAALTGSLSYIAILIYTLYVFKKETRIHLIELLPSKNDFVEFRKEIKMLLDKNANGS